MTSPHEVYVLKVALKDAKRIWRKIAIRDDQKLSDLHKAIFRAFDREEEHLYSFYMTGKKVMTMRAIHRSPEYTHPMMLEDMPDGGNAEKTLLKDLRLNPKTTFYYLFDFGDSWWHEITVTAIEPAQKKQYPAIIETHGESPPQYDYPDEE